MSETRPFVGQLLVRFDLQRGLLVVGLDAGGGGFLRERVVLRAARAGS